MILIKYLHQARWFAWLVCGLGALFYAYEYMLRISPSAMEHPLREHFGLTATGFGFLSAFYYYAYVPMQLPVGILMDRFGPRRLLTFACVVCVVGTLVFSGTSQFFVAAMGRFWVGFGSAFAFVGVLKLSTIWLPENKLALVAGMTSALGTVGAMVGDNALSHFVHSWGWQQTNNYAAIGGLFLVGILWFGIHDHKKDKESGGTIDSFRVNFIDLKLILTNKQIWINGMFGCLVYLPTTVFAELWGIPYLTHAHGLTPSAAGFANSLLFLGFTVGAPTMGYISDRIKRRKPPMVVGSLGAALMMMILLYVPGLSEYSLYVIVFTLGLFYSAQTIVFAVGRELSPSEAAGTAIAITNMLVMVGALLLQPMIGHLLDWSLHSRTTITPESMAVLADNAQYFYSAADYRWAFSIIPMGILLAAFLTLFIKETHAKAKED